MLCLKKALQPGRKQFLNQQKTLENVGKMEVTAMSEQLSVNKKQILEHCMFDLCNIKVRTTMSKFLCSSEELIENPVPVLK